VLGGISGNGGSVDLAGKLIAMSEQLKPPLAWTSWEPCASGVSAGHRRDSGITFPPGSGLARHLVQIQVRSDTDAK